MLKDIILNAYKSNLFKRFDGDFNFYFGPKDFPNLKAVPYSFTTEKGDLLKGNFYYYDEPIKGRLIVFDHGMGAGHTAYFREIEKLASRGYAVFSYDHTGCMESGGKHSNGFLTSLADLDSCLTAIKRDFRRGDPLLFRMAAPCCSISVRPSVLSDRRRAVHMVSAGSAGL